MSIAVRADGALWDHQLKAIETAARYLAAEDVEGRSCLITMPTGTGKTGVIASIVNSLPQVNGHRLVLTPWNALVVQLIDDLRGRFWNKIAEETRPDLLPVRRLPPSSDLDSIRDRDPTIYVATIAAISVAAARADEGAYDLAEVFSNFGCVLVDEGHYEPAPEWSQAIRALGRRTILLTATPYRNDEKFFSISDNWRYRFPHWKAEELRFLRKPEFATLDAADHPEAFARRLVDEVAARFPGDDAVRIVVRCQTATNIRLLVRALLGLGQTAIGVHETFEPGEEALRRAVPPTDSCDARYWVHQNKLIEGIDDRRFKVLAFYEALKNDRAIIQQIGRVLRNPRQDPADMAAVVLGRGDRNVARTWGAYRAFDSQPDAESVATLPELVDRVLEAQPLAFYYDGAYRVRIDLDSPDAWRDFAFPLRTRVFKRRPGTAKTLDDLAAETGYQWGLFDRTVYRTQEPDDRTVVVPFISAKNSPLLRSGTFIEPEFGYTAIRLDGDLLFYYDSRGTTSAVVEEQFQPLRPPDLQPLFPDGASSVTSVSLLNTDIGRQAARSRHVRAAAIDDLAPELADYAYVCTIAEGWTEISDKRVRRYLGLSRSRINDFRSGERDFESYSDWLDSLRDELAANARGAQTFTRYATYIDPPDNKDPVHLLLDIDPTEFEAAGSREALDMEDAASEVSAGSFTVVANGTEHAGTVAWDLERERYEIDIPTLQEELFVTREGETRELVRVLNTEQLVRLVPAERTAIYTRGSFFKPIVPATRAGSFRLLDILYPTPELSDAASEKGDAIVDDDWDPTSVFGLISALAPGSGREAPQPMRDIISAPDFLLCTDLGTEVADFVMTQGPRVVFVHAKASRSQRLYAASPLQVVATQAIKNLPHLQPLADIPMSTRTWAGDWPSAGAEARTRRLRVGVFGSGPDMWKHIRSVVAAPASEREVWLVLGQSLSKQALIDQANKHYPARPAAEAIQVFSLLQTTWGAVSQLGARLRIFCSP